MKIINDSDINNIIIFAKRQLGIYKLVYKKYKDLYWSAVFLTILSFILLVIYFITEKCQMWLVIGRLCCFGCATCSALALYLLQKLKILSEEKHLGIQEHRFELLKRYYSVKQFSVKEIKKVNEKLNLRKERIKQQKITVLIVLGMLLLPIWELFVQKYLVGFTFYQLKRIFLLAIAIACIIVEIVRICNWGLNLYEENIYIKYNTYLIENLIYLNSYIIQEEEERVNYGRGRRC